MSEFAVEIRKISKVWKHPNADSLDLSNVEGLTFNFVVGRDEMKVGDFVIYFPIDSLLPEKVVKFLPEPIQKKLSGNQFRIKTVKLRGEISQGLAIKMDSFPLKEFVPPPADIRIDHYNGTVFVDDYGPTEDITTILGVVKYEPPVVCDAHCNMTKLPIEAPYYDIEGCDRNPGVVQALIADNAPDVLIQEKIEGTNLAAILYQDDTVKVCQRSMSIHPLDPDLNDGKRLEIVQRHSIPEYFLKNKYWNGAVKGHLFDLADKVMNMKKELSRSFGSVTIRSELIGPGIQGNHYQIKEIRPVTFEFDLDGIGVGLDTFDSISNAGRAVSVEMVPVIFRGKLKDFLCGKSIQVASNGMSLLNPARLREGLVIRWDKPITIGRNTWTIIKQRSPEYLEKTGM